MDEKHFLYKNIADFFDSRYSEHEEVMAEKKRFALDLIDKYCPIKKRNDSLMSQPKILDIGCGTGKITQLIKNKGYKVVGADVSAVAINKLKEKGIEGIVHNISSEMPIDDQSFDVVWTTDLLELLPDAYLFFHEVHRVLRPGGLFIYTAPNLGWYLFRMKNLLGKSSSDIMPPSHCRFWTKHGINYFLNNEYFENLFLGGVAPFPSLTGKKEMRLNNLNLLCRDLVGVASRV